MTTTPSSNQTDLIEIAFIYSEQRIQARMLATPAQFRTLRDFEIARDPLDEPQAFQVLNVGFEEEAGTAAELVETITDALSVGEDHDNKAAWDKVRALAEQIDASAGGAATKTLLVEFIWDNGGGDDNLFSQSFRADVGGAESEALLEQFTEALEAAGTDDFYDFGVATEESHMNLEDLRDWLAETDDAVHAPLAVVLEQVALLGATEAEDTVAVRRTPRP